LRKGTDNSTSASSTDNITLSNGAEVFIHGELGNYYYVRYPKNADVDAKNFYFVEKQKVEYEAFVWPIPDIAHHSNSPWGYRTFDGKVHLGFDSNCPNGYPNHYKNGDFDEHACGRNCKNSIFAAAGGKVEVARENDPSFGNYVEISHGSGVRTRYAHLHSISVDQGATVSQGQTIGIMGSTGSSDGPHLHFELRIRRSGTSSDLRVNSLPGYHWEDSRSGSANPNPLFICTLCGSNAPCRGRSSENNGNHNFVYNTNFNFAFFENNSNSQWWQTS